MGNTKNNGSVLVIGAGLAGIEASLLLANSGRKVFLVEKTGHIGGSAIKFEEVFANMECSTCMVAPKQQEVLANENIELLMLSEVKDVKGKAGDFTVKVEKKARYVDLDDCIGCAACFDPCPVSLKNEFEEELSERKAIYIPCPGALPNVPSIDKENCVRFQGKDCNACEEACMFDAIKYDDKDEELDIKVDAIVVATGFSAFDMSKQPQYKYGDIDNVYTAFEFERLYASNGPTEGNIVLKNGENPKSAVIVHCVGRDEVGYCSSVCCMYSAKFVHYLRDKIPDIKITQIYSDLCVPGKSYQKFFDGAKNLDVNLVQGHDVEVADDGITVKYRDENGKEGKAKGDMVILTPAIVPRHDASDLAKTLNISQDKAGFYTEEHSELARVSTPTEGIYVAGCAQEPKDIQTTVIQAGAAVGKILSTFK